jgi:lysophospholipase L1-like esterase
MKRAFAGVAVVLLSVSLIACSENPAVVPAPQTEKWWKARHEEQVQRARRRDVDLLFIGDSITQNYEKPGPPPDEVFLPIWEEFFAPHRALNLGFSGDQTQNVLWRLQHGEVDGLSPPNIVLLIGTNNTVRSQSAEHVTAGVAAVVDELHWRMPSAKIELVEILPSGLSPEKSAKDAAVNAAIRGLYANSTYVHCLDLSSLFLVNGGLDASLFYDQKFQRAPLHPNSEGQRRMAGAVSEALFDRRDP